MRSLTCRPFTLRDAMIVVAAVAGGFAAHRLLGDEEIQDSHLWKKQGFVVVASVHLAIWTLAFLAIRVGKPRPGWRRLVREPGTAGCLVAAGVLAALAVWRAGWLVSGELEFRYLEAIRSQGEDSAYELVGKHPAPFILAFADRVGLAVAGCWAGLALGGRWRPERGWVDRLGRALGWGWIAVSVASWLGVLWR